MNIKDQLAQIAPLSQQTRLHSGLMPWWKVALLVAATPVVVALVKVKVIL